MRQGGIPARAGAARQESPTLGESPTFAVPVLSMRARALWGLIPLLVRSI